MEIFKTTSMASEKIKDLVFAKKIIQKDEFGIVILRIEAGGTIEPHLMPMKVSFYIMKGSGNFLYEGEKKQVKKGDLIEVESNTLRGWVNTGKEDLEVFVVKRKI